MSHVLRGFIARQEVLRVLATRLPRPAIVSLPQAFGLMPLSDDTVAAMHAEYGGTHTLNGFEELRNGVLACAHDLSRAGPVAYVETEYFGGHGGQSAALFRDGQLVFAHMRIAEHGAPRTSPDTWPIDVALKELGVEKADAFDEFEALGLGRWRNVEDWEKQAR